MAAHPPIRIVLAGNPNAGKTSLFNALTGSRQEVANYPGVTVACAIGQFHLGDSTFEVVDLPGIYSLQAASGEEQVAREVLLAGQFAVIVAVVDASNLARNLFLTSELLDLGLPVVIALNQIDLARAHGGTVDAEALAVHLGVPVIPTIATTRQGIPELRQAMAQAVGAVPPPGLDLPAPARAAFQALVEAQPRSGPAPRFQALRQLDDEHPGPAALAVRAALGVDGTCPIAQLRHQYMNRLAALVRQTPSVPLHARSDRIDRWLTHRLLGLPLFLLIMYLVFQLTFALGRYPMDLLATLIEILRHHVAGLWPIGSQSILRSLLVDGVIGGVGNVLIFTPAIIILFAALAVLELSGYMARVAMITDHFMTRIGLHGRSFIPLLLGFGCTVPAILATRTLECRRDRLITILILPLMSCGARLPIYSLLIPAFFPPAWQGVVLWGTYIFGLLLAVGLAKLLRVAVFRGDEPLFLIELPPYRRPPLLDVLQRTGLAAWQYARKAGTVILAAAVLLWAGATFPRQPRSANLVTNQARILQQWEAQTRTTLTTTRMSDRLLGVLQARLASQTPDTSQLTPAEQGALQQLLADPTWNHQVDRPAHDQLAELAIAAQAEAHQGSFLGRVGHALEPVLHPLGFDWRIGTALIGALAAKEVFVAQMGIVLEIGDHDAGNDHLIHRLRDLYRPLIGLCLLLFALVASPCVATVAATRAETGAWRWVLLQWGGLTLLAWLLTCALYQIGSACGF